MGSTMSFSRYEYQRLRLLARYCKGGTVLDLGYAALTNPFFHGLHRVGLDIERPGAGSAVAPETRYEEEFIGNVSDVQEIFVGRKFDNIVAGEFIEHIERPYDVLRELVPLLSPGGRLILSTPNPIGFPVFFCELLRVKRFFYSKEHVYYFCPRWVERMLDFCGYRVLKVKGVGLWNTLIPLPCPTALSYQVIYVATPAE